MPATFDYNSIRLVSRRQVFDRLDSVFKRGDDASPSAKLARQCFSHGNIGFQDENPSLPQGVFPNLQAALLKVKGSKECGAGSFLALRPDSPIHRLNDLPADCETKT